MKKNTIIAIIAFAVAIAAMLTAYFLLKEQPVEGSKTVTVEIIHDGSQRTLTIKTDAEYLYDALAPYGILGTRDDTYGKWIYSVDGRVADTSIEEWWCITKNNGEWINTGVSFTPVYDGDKFELELKTGYDQYR